MFVLRESISRVEGATLRRIINAGSYAVRPRSSSEMTTRHNPDVFPPVRVQIRQT